MKKILSLFGLLIFTSLTVLADQKPPSNWATLEDNKIHYYDLGRRKNKSALIFVHGWTCSADFWKKSFYDFPGRRVIAVDLPGHGQSDKPRTEYSMEYFARAVEAVMKKAKVERAVLVGHSMGTPVIRQFYRIYPEKTAALVVVDGSLRPFMPKAQAEQFIAPLRTNYQENAAKFIDGMLRPVRDVNLKQEIRRAMLATPDYVAISAMDAMADEKIWTNDQIKVPVLAILAESPWWQADTADFFRSIAPNLDFRMWQDVSHFLMMEKPQEFNQSIKDFVAKNKLL